MVRRQRAGRFAVATVALISILSVPVRGAETATEAEPPAPSEEQETKAQVFVTAPREQQLLQEAPYSAGVLGTDELRIDQPVRTVPESLKYQPGTLVQKTGHAQGSPYIRGFTGFRTLFLIDGIRLNNSVFRDGPNQYWNTVDAFGLSRIECVRGPFSVLYGSDAIGGTLNAVTRGVADIESGSNWDRQAYYRYASAEDSHIGRLESIGYLAEDLALSLGCTIKGFGDLEGGKEVGTQEKTGYDEQDWDVKLEFFPDEDTRLVLAHQGVDVEGAWRTHKTIYGIDWEGLKVGNELRRVLDQDRKLTYLQYHRHNIDSFCDEFQAGVSHHLQQEQRDRFRTGNRHDVQGFDVNTLGAFAQFKSPSDTGEWIYGTEYYRDWVSSFNHSYNTDGTLKKSAIQGPIADDATYDLVGVYVQDTIPVSEPMSLILGCRYDYTAVDANSVQDPNTGEQIKLADQWNAVTGSGRLLYHLDAEKRCNVFVGVSQGFRAPNLSDLTRLDSARTDEIETPSPGLDPEHFVSYEVGLKARTAGLSGQVALFHTDIRDMIVRTPTGVTIGEEHEVTKQNAGDGYVQGVEAEVRCGLGENVTAFGIFTWMDGKVETFPTSDPLLVEEPIDRLMPPTGRFGLRWDIDSAYWIEGACTVAAKADELSTRDASDTSRIPPGGTPGYTVYDVRVGCNVSSDLKLSAAVENIADEDYRIHGSGVNEPGRNIVLAAECRF